MESLKIKNMVNLFIYLLQTIRIIIFTLLYFIIPKNLKGEYILNVIYILGPTYIKLGQSLATRPDVVGIKLANNLAQLQDRVPVSSSKNLQNRIEKAFKKPLNEL